MVKLLGLWLVCIPIGFIGVVCLCVGWNLCALADWAEVKFGHKLTESWNPLK